MHIRTISGGLLNLDQVCEIALEADGPCPADAMMTDATSMWARMADGSTVTIDVYETYEQAESHLDELARLLGAVTIGLDLKPLSEVENA